MTNGPSKLECYITLGSKGLTWTNTIAYWAHSVPKAILIMLHFISSCLTHKHYTRLERPASEKHSSFVRIGPGPDFIKPFYLRNL
jgi:hypothetical protein